MVSVNDSQHPKLLPTHDEILGLGAHDMTRSNTDEQYNNYMNAMRCDWLYRNSSLPVTFGDDALGYLKQVRTSDDLVHLGTSVYCSWELNRLQSLRLEGTTLTTTRLLDEGYIIKQFNLSELNLIPRAISNGFDSPERTNQIADSTASRSQPN